MVSNVNKIGTQKGGEGGEQHKENKVARVGRGQHKGINEM